MIHDLYRSPLMRAIVLWHIGWGAVAILTDAKFMIELLNGLVLAVAVGIIVAYFHNVMIALRKRAPDDSDILVVGIWLAWVSILEARAWSTVWRAIGAPRWLLDSDFTTHIISLSLLAGIFHLAGPEAIEGKVPGRHWVRIGLIATAGALLAFGLMWAIGAR